LLITALERKELYSLKKNRVIAKENAEFTKENVTLKKENATLCKQLESTSLTEEFLKDGSNKDTLKFYTGMLHTIIMHNRNVIHL